MPWPSTSTGPSPPTVATFTSYAGPVLQRRAVRWRRGEVTAVPDGVHPLDQPAWPSHDGDGRPPAQGAPGRGPVRPVGHPGCSPVGRSPAAAPGTARPRAPSGGQLLVGHAALGPDVAASSRAQGLPPPLNRSPASPRLTARARRDVTAWTTTGPRDRASCSRWVQPLGPAEAVLDLAGVAPGHAEARPARRKPRRSPGTRRGGRCASAAAASVMVMSPIRTVTRSSMSCTVPSRTAVLGPRTGVAELGRRPTARRPGRRPRTRATGGGAAPPGRSARSASVIEVGGGRRCRRTTAHCGHPTGRGVPDRGRAAAPPDRRPGGRGRRPATPPRRRRPPRPATGSAPARRPGRRSGCSSSKPSNPSASSTAPARLANRRASSSPEPSRTVMALILTTVMSRSLPGPGVRPNLRSRPRTGPTGSHPRNYGCVIP